MNVWAHQECATKIQIATMLKDHSTAPVTVDMSLTQMDGLALVCEQ